MAPFLDDEGKCFKCVNLKDGKDDDAEDELCNAEFTPKNGAVAG